MFPPIGYLAWARRFYGKVRYDLATSGVPWIDLPDADSPDGARLPRDASAWDLFRDAIATYNGVPSQETVAALGTTHAVWLAYASLASPGDEILVEEPVYEPLVAVAGGLGVRVRRFPRPQAARFALDPGLIASAMSSRTRAVVVTNLHNPSGVRATDDELRRAAAAAGEGQASLVVDEVYAPFDGLVDPRGVFGRSARRLAPNVVAVGSLTKCYGLGPERIGWMLGPPEVVKRAEDALTATTGMLPLPHARRGLRAFAMIEHLAQRARAVVAGKRDRVARWVEEQGLSWSAPSDGLFGFVSVPDAGDLTALIESAASEYGVLVTPGAFFGAPGGFRIAWSAPEDDLKAGLTLLAQTLSSRRGNSPASARRKE
jgi:aspartate/methionine/tyrosine aminotransferase